MRTLCFALIDSGVDAGYAAFERAASHSASAATRAVPTAAPRRARRRTLSELPSAPGAEAAPAETAAAAVETAAHEVADASRPPADPLVHLRTARLGFALAVVLALCFIWSRQRRRK